MSSSRIKGKLALLISTLSGGGAERVCAILANGLAHKGWDITVVLINNENRQRILNPAVKVVDLKVKRARYAAFALAKYFRKERPNIVIAMNNEVAFAEFVSQLIFGRSYFFIQRCVTTLSSVVYHSGGDGRARLRYLVLKFILKRADLLVNQCKAMALDSAKELHLCEARVKFIYNPVGLAVHKREDRFNGAEQYILVVGRLDQNKDFRLAIRALGLMSEEHANTQLWVAGDGPERGNLNSLAHELGLEERVQFLGFQKDIASIYRKASVLALTSNFEGFPNVLLEAISHGVPIVSVDCPCGPSEIVKEDVNGYLVKGRAPQGLALAFEKTLTKVWDRQAIFKSAERFAEDNIIKQWDELLTDILDG